MGSRTEPARDRRARLAAYPGASVWALLTLMGISIPCQGAENSPDSEQVLLVPDLELLEFLGSFQTEDGEYIDPSLMLDDEFQNLLDLAARMDNAMENETENDQSGNQQ